MADKVQKIKEFLIGMAGAACCDAKTKKNIETIILPFVDSLQEEPVSDDLKKFAEEWDESLYRSDAVIAGANWQEEKMMAKAIDGHIYRQYMEDGVSIDYGVEANLDVHKHNFADGDIVRVVVIKEV